MPAWCGAAPAAAYSDALIQRFVSPSNLRVFKKTTVFAGMLRPIEKVSVAKRICGGRTEAVRSRRQGRALRPPRIAPPLRWARPHRTACLLARHQLGRGRVLSCAAGPTGWCRRQTPARACGRTQQRGVRFGSRSNGAQRRCTQCVFLELIRVRYFLPGRRDLQKAFLEEELDDFSEQREQPCRSKANSSLTSSKRSLPSASLRYSEYRSAAAL